jgi:23S rRNA pseudouridine1911/1915/1917 synthase
MLDIAPCEEPLSDPDEAAQFLRVPATCESDRLDKVLSSLLTSLSRRRLQGWIEAGYVQVNGAPAKVRQRVGPGDLITVWPQPTPESLAFVAERVDFGVVQESPEWIVVDKPAGLVTHPGAGNWHGTLLNGLLFRFPELRQVSRAGIVHRLDKDTSGLMVVARSEQTHLQLVQQLQARTVKREYIALVHGWAPPRDRVARSIGRDRHVPVRMSVDRPIAPKQAVTHYVTEAHGVLAGEPVSRVICQLETGRTHQIRVHLASLGHPLLGDILYKGRILGKVSRQMLHARSLCFDDPVGAARRCFEAALPSDMQAVLATIAWQTS